MNSEEIGKNLWRLKISPFPFSALTIFSLFLCYSSPQSLAVMSKSQADSQKTFGDSGQQSGTRAVTIFPPQDCLPLLSSLLLPKLFSPPSFLSLLLLTTPTLDNSRQIKMFRLLKYIFYLFFPQPHYELRPGDPLEDPPDGRVEFSGLQISAINFLRNPRIKWTQSWTSRGQLLLKASTNSLFPYNISLQCTYVFIFPPKHVGIIGLLKCHL